jgi:hypothetical protein
LIGKYRFLACRFLADAKIATPSQTREHEARERAEQWSTAA